MDNQNQNQDDMINHPKHYISTNGIEVIDIIEAFTEDLQGVEATDTGNIIKYICRWKNKNGVEDLKKCQWYISHLIDHLSKDDVIITIKTAESTINTNTISFATTNQIPQYKE